VVNTAGVPQLIDSGLSKTHQILAPDRAVEPENIPWSAPEILRRGQKTAASDIYAFAMTIYEVRFLVVDIPPKANWHLVRLSQIRTGKPPFSGYSSDDALAHTVVMGKRPDIAIKHFEETRWQVLLGNTAWKCWAHDPADRPTMKVILLDLAEPITPNIVQVSKYN
jgi:serine/threonine protein kinase